MRISYWSSDVCSSDLLAGLIQQDIRRHQHRIIEQASVDVVGVFGALVLELRHAIELAHLRVAVEHPAQPRVRRHMALHEQRVVRRIKPAGDIQRRSEEHTSELQSLMRISYAVFCLKKKKTQQNINRTILPLSQASD